MLAELLLQRQPRRAGHQVPNGLTAPARQGLNRGGLNQWLKGLRNRGLPHLLQLPGGFAQLLLQFRLVALLQRQQQSLHRLHQGDSANPGGPAAGSRIHAPQMTAVRIQPVPVG